MIGGLVTFEIMDYRVDVKLVKQLYAIAQGATKFGKDPKKMQSMDNDKQ